MRIFIGQVPLKLNTTHGKYSELFHVEREILEVVSVLAGTLAMLVAQVPFTPLMIVTLPSHSVLAMWLLVCWEPVLVRLLASPKAVPSIAPKEPMGWDHLHIPVQFLSRSLHAQVHPVSGCWDGCTSFQLFGDGFGDAARGRRCWVESLWCCLHSLC